MNWYRSAKKIIAEKSLYHGTIADNYDSIRENGVVPTVGDFVEEAYGETYKSIGVKLPDLSFATDRGNLDHAITAMLTHIANKLQKGFHEISPIDIRNHGMIVKIKGNQGSGDPPGNWQYKPEDDEGSEEWNYHNQNNYPTVERSDYYSTEGTGGADSGEIELLTGSALIRFLQSNKILAKYMDPIKLTGMP